MKNTLKNALLVALGIIIGGLLNSALINIGYKIIPPPAGFDLKTAAGFEAALKLFEPKNFVFPFLAHALGTFVGAFIVSYFSVKYKLWSALIVGLVFFMGGLSMVFMLSSPLWFNILDLVGAYFPFAFLAYKIASLKKS